MGFIRRVSDELKLFSFPKSIYCALVGPTVDYSSIVWDPRTAVSSQQIYRVQRKYGADIYIYTYIIVLNTIPGPRVSLSNNSRLHQLCTWSRKKVHTYARDVLKFHNMTRFKSEPQWIPLYWRRFNPVVNIVRLKSVYY